MKKITILLLIASICTLASACHFGRHSTIVETGNNYYLRIEYSGRIHFNNDGTMIASISRGGYLKYERNEKRLEARNDGRGGISYKLSDNGEPIDYSKGGKEFITEAVHIMLQKNHRPNWE